MNGIYYKNRRVLRKALRLRCAFILDKSRCWSVLLLCRVMDVHHSGFLHLWTTSVLQVPNMVLGCCLHLSGIRKICAQMDNPHTIASTTGRPLRPVKKSGSDCASATCHHFSVRCNFFWQGINCPLPDTRFHFSASTRLFSRFYWRPPRSFC